MKRSYQVIEKPRTFKKKNRVWLTVPYEEKDIVKSLGAKWDSKKKKWYAGDMQTEKQVQKWIPYQP